MENQKIYVTDLIYTMGDDNKGKNEKFTLQYVNNAISAIIHKKRKDWPSANLRKQYNNLDKVQQKYFLETLFDMRDGIEDAFESGLLK